MKRLGSFVPCLLIILSSLQEASAIDLAGTVLDRAGRGLSGVEVSLSSGGAPSTTDEEGKWRLGGSTTRLAEKSASKNRLRVTPAGTVELSLGASALVSVESFDLAGSSLGGMKGQVLPDGVHQIPLPLPTSGVVWWRISVDGRPEFLMATAGIGFQSVASPSLAQGRAAVSARTGSIQDTIVFSWKSNDVVKIPVRGVDTSGILARIDTSTVVSWNASVAKFGSLYDSRDGQVYRTLKLKDQVWMAENLNYSASGKIGVCSGTRDGSVKGPEDTCSKYGRLYSWHEAMNGDTLYSSPPIRADGICPKGWHVPSIYEIASFLSFVDSGFDSGAIKLRSMEGWLAQKGDKDPYGFRALPAGWRYTGTKGTVFSGKELSASWWTSTRSSGISRTAHILSIDRFASTTESGLTIMIDAHSLRCIQD